MSDLHLHNNSSTDDEEFTKPKSKAKSKSNSKAVKAVKTKESQLSEADAMSYVKGMRLSLTGARVGDVIVGKHNINHKALLQVVGQPILPCRRDLDGLRSFPDTVWPLFLRSVQCIPFFAAMSLAEREQWFKDNQSQAGAKDHYIGDDPQTVEEEVEVKEGEGEQSGTRVLLIQPGETKIKAKKINTNGKKTTKGFCDLSEQTLEILSTTASSPHAIEQLCSPNHSTKAQHVILSFIKRLWRLEQGTAPLDPAIFRGTAIHLSNGVAHAHQPGGGCLSCSGGQEEEKKEPDGREIWYSVNLGEGEDGAIIVARPTRKMDLSDAATVTLVMDALDVAPDGRATTEEIVRRCILANRGLTSSGFKSLLQKLIRFQPHLVRLNRGDSDAECVPANIALCVAVVMQVRNQGSFVPDIQRFVTGLEALTKRLPVTCGEDAWPDPSVMSPAASSRELASMLIAAKLAQSNYAWFPERALIVRWMRFAVAVQKSSYAWDWNVARGAAVRKYRLSDAIIAAAPVAEELQGPKKALVLCSLLLDNVRSFKGDLDLMRDIASSQDPFSANHLVSRLDKDSGMVLAYDATPPKQRLIMPLCHAVDFHWNTDFVYHMDPLVVETIGSDAKPSPYAAVFSETWKQSSSLNPRKAGRYADKEKDVRSSDSNAGVAASAAAAASSSAAAAAAAAAVLSLPLNDAIFYRGVEGYSYLSEMVEGHPFVAMLREAQWLLLQTKRYDSKQQQQQEPRKYLAEEAPYCVKYLLDTAWLSAMVGPIEVKVKLEQDVVVAPAAAAAAAAADVDMDMDTDSEQEERKTSRKQGKGKGKKKPASKVVIEAKGTKSILVSLKTTNPYVMVAMRKPARGNKNGVALQPHVVDEALKLVRHKLIHEGVPMQAARAPCAALANKTLFLVIYEGGEGEEASETLVLFTKSAAAAHRKKKNQSTSSPKKKTRRGKKNNHESDEEEEEKKEEAVSWEDARNITVNLPVCEPLAYSPWATLATAAERGVSQGFDALFDELLASTPFLHLQRCLTFIGGCRDEIHMHRISREGRGQQHAVSVGDVGAYQFLLRLSLLAPAALQPILGLVASPGGFRVGCGPLMWTLCERIRVFVQHGPRSSKVVVASAAAASSSSSSSSAAPQEEEYGWDQFPFVDSKERVPRPSQIKCLNELLESRLELDRRARFLWQRVGQGKTLIMLLYIKHLASLRKLPKYILLSAPRATLAHLIKEIGLMGLEAHPLIPTKNYKSKAALFSAASAAAAASSSKRKRPRKVTSSSNKSSKSKRQRTSRRKTQSSSSSDDEDSSSDSDSDTEPEEEEDDPEDKEEHDVKRMRPWVINVVEHDDMRRCKSQVVELGKDLLFVLDEADKCFHDSLRTSAAIDIAQNASDTLLMTGTVLVDANINKLIQWLVLCVNCAVTARNVWSIANSMVSSEPECGVSVVYPELPDADVRFQALPGSWERYKALAPVRLGGTNLNPTHASFNALCALCWDVCDHWLVHDILQKQPRPCAIETRSLEHSQIIKRLLLSKIAGLVESDIYVLHGGNSTFVTPDSVRGGGPLYRFFLFSMSNNRGFDLTAYAVLYTGVYFCNQSTRTQSEGRLIRMSQEHAQVEVIRSHCGILTNLHARQQVAKNMSEVLADLKRDFGSA